MFHRSQQAQYELIESTRFETMSQLVEPLKRVLPNLAALLIMAIKNNDSPVHVGEILAVETARLIEMLENQGGKKVEALQSKVYDLERESKKKEEQYTKDRGVLSKAINQLKEKNEDLSKQIRIQNTLIADLHRKISNLTSAADSSS
jgi:predicted RNase H-like nuclease (RuvC/YqgF family)